MAATIFANDDAFDASHREAFHRAILEGRLAWFLDANAAIGSALLFQTVADLVYARLTRRVERARGHYGCASSPAAMQPECWDRFMDDVVAVRADLLRHADKPIENVEGWMASRLTAVTVDAHRRRRGERGAQQRPRLPGWLRAALGDDKKLTALALDILTWAGVPAVAPTGLWPLGVWAERYASAPGSPQASESRIAADVETVLAAMRTRQAWYDRYVEIPLGRKTVPVVPAPRAGDSPDREPDHLALVSADEMADARQLALAAEAIEALAARLALGEDPDSAVVAVVHLVFGAGSGAETAAEEMDRAPGEGTRSDEAVMRMLADPEAVARLVQALTAVIEEGSDPKPS